MFFFCSYAPGPPSATHPPPRRPDSRTDSYEGRSPLSQPQHGAYRVSDPMQQHQQRGRSPASSTHGSLASLPHQAGRPHSAYDSFSRLPSGGDPRGAPPPQQHPSARTPPAQQRYPSGHMDPHRSQQPSRSPRPAQRYPSDYTERPVDVPPRPLDASSSDDGGFGRTGPHQSRSVA